MLVAEPLLTLPSLGSVGLELPLNPHPLIGTKGQASLFRSLGPTKEDQPSGPAKDDLRYLQTFTPMDSLGCTATSHHIATLPLL